MEGVYAEVTQETIHTGEASHLLAIEREKNMYTEAFGKLRELKGIIEHVKCLLEKNRTKMQKDFDTWYRDMCKAHTLSEQPAVELGNEDYGETRTNRSAQGADIPDDNSNRIDRISKSSLEQKQVHSGTASSTFELPPGARLTGNREADEDIIAFYKAKEALLTRSQRK